MADSPDTQTHVPTGNGRRASFDPATGEVHGSGVGAGGGQTGEDYDNDPMSGSDYPQTGGEHTDHESGGKGPAHVNE